MNEECPANIKHPLGNDAETYIFHYSDKWHRIHFQQESFINSPLLLFTNNWPHGWRTLGFPCGSVMLSAKAGDGGWEDPLEEEIATHSSILAWEMDRGAWWATVHGVAKESDMTEQLNNNVKNPAIPHRGYAAVWGQLHLARLKHREERDPSQIKSSQCGPWLLILASKRVRI